MKGAYNILADIKYVAALAGEKTLLDQNQLKLKTKKNRKDIVTKADSRAEELILSGLVGYGFNILTEEKGYIDRKSECTFIVDPIEGTTNYSQGHPDWAVSIGLQEGDKMVAGVVYSASDKKMYSAIRGKGAFLNGSKIRVSNKDKLEDSFINAAYLDDMSRFNILMAPIWDKSLKTDVMGSMAKSFCYTAQGIYAASIGLSSKLWDYAAASVIVEEAGGVISRFDGKAVDFNNLNEHIVASNRAIHRQIIAHLNKVNLEEVVQK